MGASLRRVLSAIVWLSATVWQVSAFAADKPNIVYILLDDLGYGDFGCYNPECKIPTPHVDALAKQGMMFLDAHSPSAVCTPTRYGLLTGRYAWRTPLQVSVLGGLSAPLIERDRLTVGQLLQENGYRTMCVGKWHLGLGWQPLPGKRLPGYVIETPAESHYPDYAKPILDGPVNHGFHEFYGIAGTLDMVPYTYIRDDAVTILPEGTHSYPMMQGVPGRNTRPGPAAPGFDPATVIADFTREAIAGIERCAADAKAGKPFFLYLAYASPHTPIVAEPEWTGKTGINPYTDMVSQNDKYIGDVMAALDRQGLAENTLVIVTADNGCSPEADFEKLHAAGHRPSAGWRGMKADIFEGGHRVPFIVRWPGVVAAGSESRQLVGLNDFMATVAGILEVPIPETEAVDSISFLPALKGEASDAARKNLVHHSIDGSFGIRQGDWKLCLCPGSGGWSAPRMGIDPMNGLPVIQLFNLRDDPAEKANRQEENLELAKSLFDVLREQIESGRSTPGPRQQNAVEVNMWKFIRR